MELKEDKTTSHPETINPRAGMIGEEDAGFKRASVIFYTV
jgi:hypothetical protein